MACKLDARVASIDLGYARSLTHRGLNLVSRGSPPVRGMVNIRDPDGRIAESAEYQRIIEGFASAVIAEIAVDVGDNMVTRLLEKYEPDWSPQFERAISATTGNSFERVGDAEAAYSVVNTTTWQLHRFAVTLEAGAFVVVSHRETRALSG